MYQSGRIRGAQLHSKKRDVVVTRGLLFYLHERTVEMHEGVIKEIPKSTV